MSAQRNARHPRLRCLRRTRRRPRGCGEVGSSTGSGRSWTSSFIAGLGEHVLKPAADDATTVSTSSTLAAAANTGSMWPFAPCMITDVAAPSIHHTLSTIKPAAAAVKGCTDD